MATASRYNITADKAGCIGSGDKYDDAGGLL